MTRLFNSHLSLCMSPHEKHLHNEQTMKRSTSPCLGRLGRGLVHSCRVWSWPGPLASPPPRLTTMPSRLQSRRYHPSCRRVRRQRRSLPPSRERRSRRHSNKHGHLWRDCCPAAGDASPSPSHFVRRRPSSSSSGAGAKDQSLAGALSIDPSLSTIARRISSDSHSAASRRRRNSSILRSSRNIA